MNLNNTAVAAIKWEDNKLLLLDQRELPNTVNYRSYTQAPEVAKAIKNMCVRGAPAIGISAAYAVALSVQQYYSSTNENWLQQVNLEIQELNASRPTAVNLTWALKLMQQALEQIKDNPIAKITALAKKIHADDIVANQTIGELGANVIGESIGVLTHCNAGALATGGYGTALGVIRSSVQRGLKTIYAAETRPWLQGARLTVWELAQDNISSTLISDSSAAELMRTQAIDWIIVGADRIAANGDVANKIGTYSLAILAKFHQIKFMVAAPTSTIDWNLNTGSKIPIEHRTAQELLPACYTKNKLINAWNPVFDLTPANLITAIVTEKGVVFNPNSNNMKTLQC